MKEGAGTDVGYAVALVMPQATNYPDPALECGSRANPERQGQLRRLGGWYMVATYVKPTY
jgi:hypothetical protein